MNNSRSKSVTTKQLFTYMNTPNSHIIDIRNSNSYNGWCENNEERKGHISGAGNIPYKCFNRDGFYKTLLSKNIYKPNKIIVYGYNSSDIRSAIVILNGLGFYDVYSYTSFIDEWCKNSIYPMETLKRYRQLVSPLWLNRLINSKPQENNNNFLIFQAYFHTDTAYTQGHIPGTIKLNTTLLESVETWNRLSPKELKHNLENLGITMDTTVILYGRTSEVDMNSEYPGSSTGQLAAFRIAVIMLYAGVGDVRILNGGLQSWIESGFTITKEKTLPYPVSDFGCLVPKHPEYFIDLEQVKSNLYSEEMKLVSVRSRPEYIGKVSGYSYIKKKGRIPGSLFCDCGSDSYHMENFRNYDNTTRGYKEIIENWASNGIVDTNKNIFYCGTAWKACEAWFNGWLAGWNNICVYDGGWYEWTMDDNNPIEIGDITN